MPQENAVVIEGTGNMREIKPPRIQRDENNENETTGLWYAVVAATVAVYNAFGECRQVTMGKVGNEQERRATCNRN